MGKLCCKISFKFVHYRFKRLNVLALFSEVAEIFGSVCCTHNVQKAPEKKHQWKNLRLPSCLLPGELAALSWSGRSQAKSPGIFLWVDPCRSSEPNKILTFNVGVVSSEANRWCCTMKLGFFNQMLQWVCVNRYNSKFQWKIYRTTLTIIIARNYGNRVTQSTCTYQELQVEST